MIKLTATGPIHSISPVIEIPSKTGGTPFLKRELVIDDTWVDHNGNAHPNFVLIEFTGDNMQQLGNFAPGHYVTVNAYVNGREHNGRVFNTIKGQSVAPYQPQQQPTQAAQYAAPQPQHPQQPYAQGAAYPQQGQAYPQQPAYSQQPYPQQPTYPQQPSYPNQGGYAPSYPQQQAPGPVPVAQQGGNPGVDDLPFR